MTGTYIADKDSTNMNIKNCIAIVLLLLATELWAVDVSFQYSGGSITKNGNDITAEEGHIYLGTIEATTGTYYITMEENDNGTMQEAKYLPRRKNTSGQTQFILYIGLYQSNPRVMKIHNGRTSVVLATYNITITENTQKLATPITVNQSTVTTEVRKAEREKFKALVSDYNMVDIEGDGIPYYNKPYWKFDYPLEKIWDTNTNKYKTIKMTSPFAEPRNFSNVSKVIHEGVDLIVYEPGKIPAVTTPADGKIAATFSNLELHGNVVAIDHGEGIISILAHLNSFGSNTTQDTTVEEGDAIGVIGSTGATNNKIHVHWTTMINGEIVDPIDFISLFP